MYNQKIIDVFAAAKNAGVLKGANGVGTATDTICGDVVRIYLNIQNDKIVEARFKAFGCVATIASASVLTDIVISKTVDQAQHLTDTHIYNAL
ncbi:MAG: iron-sulfur cluster assembly scaffold protein, partial [Clostridia bacterium]|nr:iron-sulfur cluster assembly scaffold protein [Clostridia bacterium]